jgi:hypothetical protein
MKKSPMLLLAAIAALALAACGDDDGGDASKDLKLTASEPSGGKVEIEVPDEVAAGRVSIELKNDGKGDHDAQLIRIEGEHSTEEAARVFDSTGEGKPIPEWFRAEGGIGTTKAGETRTATQVLVPGRYIAFDTEGGGGPESEGPPNYKRGGLVEFEVTGDAAGDLPASAGPTIRAADYSFETFDLRSGRNDVVFQNTGREPHHVVAAPIVEGKTIEDVEQALQEEGESDEPPPIDEASGASTAVIDGGRTQIAQLELRPGRYALLCFISDRRGGPPHVARGMIAEATVR